MKVKCSAPGKVIVSGEHSVVYGKHALVTAVSLRCYVTVEEGEEVRIRSQLGVTGIDFEVHPYVSNAIILFEERFGKVFRSEMRGTKPEVTIESEIPVASGLGSSAAVTVSTLKALSCFYGVELGNEEIFKLAKEVEVRVQGRASGVDPFVSTHGGAWLMPERERLEFDAEMLVVDSGENSVTAEMVRKVAELRERFPGIVEKIFDTMDSITLEICDALARGGGTEDLRRLFRMNHCMLKAIGVSTPALDRLVERLEEFGLATKLTGAGGGGCVLAVGEREEIERAFSKVKSAIKLRPEMEGVRVEEVS